MWVCGSGCKSSISVRSGSLFERSHLNLDTLMFLLYMWSDEYSHEKVIRELKLNKNTVVSWYKSFRDLCIDFVCSDENAIGGIDDDGYPIDVEIDESLFFK